MKKTLKQKTTKKKCLMDFLCVCVFSLGVISGQQVVGSLGRLRHEGDVHWNLKPKLHQRSLNWKHNNRVAFFPSTFRCRSAGRRRFKLFQIHINNLLTAKQLLVKPCDALAFCLSLE